MNVRDETFAVWIAGEQITDGLGISYIYITTPLGRVRMTEDEAEVLGHKLIHAAGCVRSLDDEDEPTTDGGVS